MTDWEIEEIEQRKRLTKRRYRERCQTSSNGRLTIRERINHLVDLERSLNTVQAQGLPRK